MEGYIHFYEENAAFDADYNTPEYYEPWLSYTYNARRTDYNKRNRAEETHLWLDGADAGRQVRTDFRGTTAQVTVHAKGGWTASCVNCSASVTGVSDTAITETTVAVTFAANTSSAPRAVTVTFTNTSDRTITRSLVVTQAGRSYVSMTAGGTAPYDGGAVELTVTTNIGATLSAPAGTSLDTASVGSGTSVVTLTVPARTSSQTAETSYTVTATTTDYSASDGVARTTAIARQEGYPYLNAGNVAVASDATNGSVPYSSNYGVAVTYHDAGLTNVSVGSTAVSFTIADAPGFTAGSWQMTLAATGQTGPDISETVTVTRPAQTATLSVSNKTTSSTPGSFDWTFTSNDSVSVQIVGSPSWLTLNGVTGTTARFTVTQNTAGADRTATVRFTTAHNGTGGTPVTVDRVLTQTYIEYVETLTAVTVQSVTLTYNDTNFLANGSASTSWQYCKPSTFKVSYTARYSNNYDSTTRSEPGQMTGTGNIGSIKYTTGAGGSVNGTYVYAAGRGTTAGAERTVCTITGVTFSISGFSFTEPVSIVFTQEKNEITATTQTTSTRTTTASTPYSTTYSNVSVTMSASETSFKANGRTAGNATAATVTATETGKTTEYYKVTLYTDTAYTYTWTSGKQSTGSSTDTTGVAQADSQSTSTYTLNRNSAISKKSGSDSSFGFTAGTSSAAAKVTAAGRGTTAGSARSVYLGVSALRDSSKTASVTLTQEKNEITGTTQTTSTRTVTASSPYSTTYSNVSITMSASETSFKANGNTPQGATAITVTATETGNSVAHYKVTRYTDTAYTYTWTSGGQSTGSSTDPTGVALSDKTTSSSYSLNRTSAITKTSASDSAFALTTGSSSTKVTAPNRGTTAGNARTCYLTVSALRDSSKTASATLTQEKNEVTGTRQGTQSTQTVTGITGSRCEATPSSITGSTGNVKSVTVVSYVNTATTANTYSESYDVYTSGGEKLTGSTFVSSAVTSSGQAYVKPTTAWTSSPTYGTITISYNGQDHEEFEFRASYGGSVTPPSATSANGTLRFTNPSATSSYDRVNFYYSGTGQTVTYYRTLSLLNVFRTTQTTGSCGNFYPKCKVTVSLNGKASKSVTITGASKQNDRGVWVGNGTMDISSWNIPVGTTCTGTITYLMISESGGSWSPSSWSGSLTGIGDNSTTIFLDDSNVVNLPSGAEGYFHYNCG